MTVVSYDKHGCGQSDRDRRDFGLEAELLDLETVIGHLGLGPCEIQLMEAIMPSMTLHGKQHSRGFRILYDAKNREAYGPFCFL